MFGSRAPINNYVTEWVKRDDVKVYEERAAEVRAHLLYLVEAFPYDVLEWVMQRSLE